MRIAPYTDLGAVSVTWRVREQAKPSFGSRLVSVRRLYKDNIISVTL